MQEWLFFGTGVALTLMGIWITLHLRPGRRLNVFIRSRHLTDRSMAGDPEIKLSFQGKEVAGIATHRVFLWNSGNISIRESDISPDNPLSIEFNPGSLHQVRQITKVGQTFKLQTVTQGSMVVINLNHLDIGQGFVIDVVEAIMDMDQYVSPIINGYVLDSKGIKGGVKPVSFSEISAQRRSVIVMIFVLPIVAFLIDAALEMYFLYAHGDPYRPFDKIGIPALAVIGIYYLFLVVSNARPLIPPIRYRIPDFSDSTR